MLLIMKQSNYITASASNVYDLRIVESLYTNNNKTTKLIYTLSIFTPHLLYVAFC